MVALRQALPCMRDKIFARGPEELIDTFGRLDLRDLSKIRAGSIDSTEASVKRLAALLPTDSRAGKSGIDLLISALLWDVELRQHVDLRDIGEKA